MHGHRGPHGAYGARLLREDPRDDRLRRRARVWRLAGEHFIKNRAERIDVGTAVDGAVARRLLRAHVGRRAETQARLRDSMSARL